MEKAVPLPPLLLLYFVLFSFPGLTYVSYSTSHYPCLLRSFISTSKLNPFRLHNPRHQDKNFLLVSFLFILVRSAPQINYFIKSPFTFSFSSTLLRGESHVKPISLLHSTSSPKHRHSYSSSPSFQHTPVWSQVSIIDILMQVLTSPIITWRLTHLLPEAVPVGLVFRDLLASSNSPPVTTTAIRQSTDKILFRRSSLSVSEGNQRMRNKWK